MREFYGFMVNVSVELLKIQETPQGTKTSFLAKTGFRISEEIMEPQTRLMWRRSGSDLATQRRVA